MHTSASLSWLLATEVEMLAVGVGSKSWEDGPFPHCTSG